MKDIVEFSEVREFIDTPVKRYSSGMFVKLAFSVAAHLDSEILIMDEVLAVGDMAFQMKCLDKMIDVSRSQGRTVLYVSHNMNTIRRLCDRCIVIDEGKVIFDGDVEKGIDIYLSDSRDKEIMKDRYLYDDSYHIWKSHDFRIMALEMRNTGLECSSKFTLKLEVKSTKEWHNVFFRFEITVMNDIKIATMFSDKGVDFKQGDEKRIAFLLDTAHLRPQNTALILSPMLPIRSVWIIF